MLIGPAARTIKLNFRIAKQKPVGSADTHSHVRFAIQQFEMKSASIGAATIAAATSARYCESQRTPSI
jgi:hypothetical protein